MSLFSNLKWLSPQMGRILGLSENCIHPMKQADIMFSEIQRKKQFILDMAANFEKKMSQPSDCIFWIRTATKQVLDNEILLRKNKKNLALIRALGDLLPRKVETTDEFCELVHQEWSLLAQKQLECQARLQQLKIENYAHLESQVKKSVTLENLKSLDVPKTLDSIAEMTLSQKFTIPIRAHQEKNPLERLTLSLNDCRIQPANPQLKKPSRPEKSLPLVHGAKAHGKTRSEGSAVLGLTQPASHLKTTPINKKNSEISPIPNEEVLTKFAQFLGSVLHSN